MSQAQVVILGAGAIGRELLAQIVSNQRSAAKLSVCGVVDRSGYVFNAEGLSRETVLGLCVQKASGRAIANFGSAAVPAASVDAISRGALTRPIVVDATAAETGQLLQTALSRGFDAVLANKLPLSSSQAEVDELHSVARTYQRRILYEATVGAGLPVIDTLHKLIDAGDEVLRVEGCPSGTLGFLFGELHAGRTFAEALRDAIGAGYTEPDPRTDLSGVDVARKALILGRQIGFRGDLSAVGIESLVPSSLRDVSLSEFLDRLDELNPLIAARVERARLAGRVLRYRASVTKTEIKVGVAEVDSKDPLSTLSGTDNQFTFTTSRYSQRQLVITGPGAGAQVTASGVHNDLLRLTERLN
jgi:aspartokinase/homoserine dehydrogenase 1